VAKEPSNSIIVVPLIDSLIQKRNLPKPWRLPTAGERTPKQRVEALVYRASILMLSA